MDRDDGIDIQDLPAIYREGYLYVGEVARTQHDHPRTGKATAKHYGMRLYASSEWKSTGLARRSARPARSHLARRPQRRRLDTLPTRSSLTIRHFASDLSPFDRFSLCHARYFSLPGAFRPTTLLRSAGGSRDR